MNGRVGILGDLHSEDLRLKVALEFFEKSQVDFIVCTGDIADGRGNIDKSCELLKLFSVTCVRGNHDRWLLDNKVRHIPEAHLCADLNVDSLAFLNDLELVERLGSRRRYLSACAMVCWIGICTKSGPAQKERGLNVLKTLMICWFRSRLDLLLMGTYIIGQ